MDNVVNRVAVIYFSQRGRAIVDNCIRGSCDLGKSFYGVTIDYYVHVNRLEKRWIVDAFSIINETIRMSVFNIDLFMIQYYSIHILAKCYTMPASKTSISSELYSLVGQHLANSASYFVIRISHSHSRKIIVQPVHNSSVIIWLRDMDNNNEFGEKSKSH